MSFFGHLKALQIRAARALLDWSQDDLAEQTGLSINTIRKLELGHISPRAQTMSSLRSAFENAGLEFLEPDGVRHRLDDIKTYRGRDGFVEFLEDVHATMNRESGEICVSGVDEKLFVEYEGDFASTHMERMAELYRQNKIVSMRILVAEGDRNFVASSYATYKWQAKQYFAPTSFYLFGDCLALISFTNRPAPYVILIRSTSFAEAYRHSFNLAWEMARNPIVTIEKSKTSRT